MYNSIQIIKQINICLAENNIICDYLCSDFINNDVKSYNYIDKLCTDIIQYLDKLLNIQVCKNISSTVSFECNIINEGVSSQLDEIVKFRQEKISIFVLCLK